MSLITKSATGSLNAKPTDAVWPLAKLDWLLEIAMVGGIGSSGIVLTEIVTVLFVSPPSKLKLPAASVNFPLATLTTPFVVLLAFGMNVAK